MQHQRPSLTRFVDALVALLVLAVVVYFAAEGARFLLTGVF